MDEVEALLWFLAVVIVVVLAVVFGGGALQTTAQTGICANAAVTYPQYEPFMDDFVIGGSCYVKIVTSDDKTLYFKYDDFAKSFVNPMINHGK